MSEENKEAKKTSEAGGGDDPSAKITEMFSNFKAESERKMGNMTDTLKAVQQQNQQLAELLKPKEKPQEDDDDGFEYMTKAERQAIQRMTEKQVKEAEERVKRDMEAKARADQERGMVLAELQQDYPELGDRSSDLFIEADKVHQGLDPSLQGTPHGYRIAVREAAAKKGVLPMSSRPKQTSDDVLGGGRKSPARDRKGDDELDWRTEDFAKAVGLNVDDEEVRKRIVSRQRSNWGQWK